jgi:hypothetical protein
MAYFKAINENSAVCERCAFKFSAHYDDSFGLLCPTITGRMPSRGPLLQNVLIRTEEGAAIKNALGGKEAGDV